VDCFIHQQLNEAIDKAWEAIPEDRLTHLMLGMPKRMDKVFARRGKYIGM
jgi:hypothetical protein